MPAFTATAPGKIILFGEHAVVYDRPAIAVPVMQVRARAVVMPDPRAPAGRIRLQAPDIDLEADFADLPAHHPLVCALKGVFSELGIQQPPACTLRVTSTIPIAAGMGSGAAVSVAVIRALAAFLGHALPAERVSALAYEVEKLHHGTPSGIDNTVVTYGAPVIYQRGRPIEFLQVGAAFMLMIADTGIASPTSVAVGDVRRAWEKQPAYYEALFDQIAGIVRTAREVIENGDPRDLGPLMDDNQDCLARMDVSSPELDRLVAAARRVGALGAKLSGAGRGGNLIALVTPQTAEQVAAALQARGAVRTILVGVESSAAAMA
jgi:mevalonate kinase